MICSGRTLLLSLASISLCFHRAPSQEASPAGRGRPLLERLHRLEAQVQRLQEASVAQLQDIALSMDVQFRSLSLHSQAAVQALNHSWAALHGDLGQLRASLRKMQRRGRRVDARLQALGAALTRGNSQQMQEREARREALSSLARDLRAQQDALAHLLRLVQSQGARLAALELPLQRAGPGMAALLWPAHPNSPEPPQGRQTPVVPPEPGHLLRDFTARLEDTQAPRGPGSQGTRAPESHQENCNMGPVLTFPTASTENAVFLQPGFQAGLRALSVCSWVRTALGRLGTLLSYATEDNDNKLVLHGRDSLRPGSIHLVIGDPAFRELPLQSLLDGHWHHVCVLWASVLGSYWLHVDRSLVATGSGFRKGYEIPAGGSLVLGQEQDRVGGGFDSAESFVGSLAGLAIWDRVLVPGEVSELATGKALPEGAILTLANATLEGGVRWASCSCLPLCP
ncbi:pentraxin-4 [Sorex fumeus]|uniref:pentraxin-4 n=1 Tax=Sorex fumeus TaxID=62283 RepID=UPI0024AD555B|nr:pentraxin-4 [Sorex fumeus]